MRRLEDYLANREGVPEVDAHLRQCAGCRNEMALLTEQNSLFQTLRPDPDADPAGGFYARVMHRIEAQGRQSVWSLFGESLFAKRLAYASLSLLLLSSALMFSSSDPPELMADSTPEVVLGVDRYTPVGENPERDREVVFTSLVSHRQ